MIMGLTFWVGGTNWFSSPLNENLERALHERFGLSVSNEGGTESTQYGEVGWSGWSALQELASDTLGAANVPHLCSMEAWFGVYLPFPVEPVTLLIPSFGPPLDCASLPALYEELRLLASERFLPVEAAVLSDLWHHYKKSDEDGHADKTVQTYVQLMLAVQEATVRSLPLWVVK